MVRKAWLVVLAALMLSGVTGCGGGKPLGPVTGKVSYKGKPLSVKNCVIMFEIPNKGIGLGARLEDDGTFRVVNLTGDGLEPGHYQVSITLPPDFMAGLRMLPPKEVDRRMNAVFPRKYINSATSGLEIDVATAGQVLDIELKD